MFNNLMKKTKNKFNKNIMKNKFLSSCPIFIIDEKLLNILHKLHSHVCHKKIYKHKRFQKFITKILTTIACQT